MLFFCVIALLCVNSIWSLSIKEQLYDVLNKETHEIPKIKKEYPLKIVQDSYQHLRYYVEIGYSESSQDFNITGFAENWVVGNGNVSRTQAVLYVNGNTTGLPFEVISDGSMNNYLIYQTGNDASCSFANNSAEPNFVYHYIGTRFLTPEFDDYGVIWGPRLVDLYSSASGAYTTVTAAIDSFNFQLVVFNYHYHSSTKLLDYTLFVHDADNQPFNVENVEVPVTVQCLEEMEEGPLSIIGRVPFPQALF